MTGIPVENRKRGIDNNLGIFTQALMWFMDGAVTQEKLGMVKLMLCNLNGDCDCDDKIKEKINPMIDTLIDLIGEIQENKKVVDFNSRQSFWLHLRRKEQEKEKERTEDVKEKICQACQQVCQQIQETQVSQVKQVSQVSQQAALKQKSVDVVASLMSFVTSIVGSLRTIAINVKKF